MCGLAGIARFGAHPATGMPDPDQRVPSMVDAVRHRGPDGVALSPNEGNVRLGFARLGLVGLEDGDQPLYLEDGSLALIANGEVYNHRELAGDLGGIRLRTRSDCEVLLHLYRARGPRFLDDVRGMFSLVLWDKRENTLVMARDPFGIKPLFFHANHERIVFASQITALFEDEQTPRRVDWGTALTHQMMTGDPYFSSQQASSWFEDIHMVRAATILTVDLASGTRHEHRYWSLAGHSLPVAEMSVPEITAEYRSRLEASVHDCEHADVEVGLFLSGGIDSAAIAALSTTRPHTFSALNASTLRNGDFAASVRVAEILDLENDQVLFPAGHTPSPDEWLRFLWLMETPLAGPEAYYKYDMYRYVRATQPQVKAMMIGGGADEFNGGYTAMLGAGGWDDVERSLDYLRHRALQRQAGLVGSWEGAGGLLSTGGLERLVDADRTDTYADFVAWKYRDVQQYNCWHEDRSAAGSGIEARVPFLDRALVELSVAVPPGMRRELLWDKQILRNGMPDLLPPDLVKREKIPFFYGPGVSHTYRCFGQMLLAESTRLFDQAMSTTGARNHLDADALRSTLDAVVRRGEPGQLELVLRLVNLGLLESMLQDLPAHHADHTSPPPTGFFPGREPSAEEVALNAVGLHVTRTTVGVLDDSVHVLNDGTSHFIVVNGEVEYVVDPDEDPAWARVLLGLDGTASLGDLCTSEEFDAIAETFAMAVDAGVVRVATPER